MLPGCRLEYHNKVRSCLALLKTHIKQSATSYQQLADRTGVSLLTIKRQLNGDEISMTKLLALCDAAQIRFCELWEQVEQRKVEHNVFTDEQDKAFYHFPHLLRYFLELQLAKQTPEQIQQQWQISPASTHLYLRKLETLGLILLSEKGHPTMLMSEPVGFSGNSLNLRKGVKKGLEDICAGIMSPGQNGEGETFVITKPMILADHLREKMYQEMSALVSRYAELSERYFVTSDIPAYQLVVCDYKMGEPEPLPDIINVVDFNLNRK